MQSIFDILVSQESPSLGLVIFLSLFSIFIAIFHTLIFASLWKIQKIPSWFFFVLNPLILILVSITNPKFFIFAFVSLAVSVFLFGILGFLVNFILSVRKAIVEKNNSNHQESTSSWKIILSSLMGLATIVLFFTNTAIFVLVFFLISMFALILPSKKKKFYKYQGILPSSKISSLAMGLVEIKGDLRMHEAMIAPIGDKKCIGYRYVIESINVDSDGRESYSEILDKTKVNFFSIEDNSGVLKVKPDNIELINFDVSDRYRRSGKRYSQYLLNPGQEFLMIGHAGLENNQVTLKYEKTYKLLGIMPAEKVDHYNLFKPLLTKFIAYSYIFATLVAFILLTTVTIKEDRVVVGLDSIWTSLRNFFNF